MLDKERFEKWARRRNEVLAVHRTNYPLAEQVQELVRLGFQATTEIERSPVTGEYYQWWQRVPVEANH